MQHLDIYKKKKHHEKYSFQSLSESSVLFIRSFKHLSAFCHLAIYPFIRLFIHLFAHLSILPSINPIYLVFSCFVYQPSIYSSIRPFSVLFLFIHSSVFIHPSVFFFSFIHLSFDLFICPFVLLSIISSIYPSTIWSSIRSVICQLTLSANLPSLETSAINSY